MTYRLAVLYCCQGGACKGYRDVGFETVGVDLFPQPRYPWTFVQMDAVEFVKQHGDEFDAFHASPPCQLYSDTHRLHGTDWPDLIGPTRDALNATGKPWIIENVDGARDEMRDPVTLCGAMFGLHTYRHRLIETGGGFRFTPPEHPTHTQRTVKMGRPLKPGDFYHAVGNFTSVDYVRRDMGVPWMNRDGIRECIPPAYGEAIGTALRKHLDTTH